MNSILHLQPTEQEILFAKRIQGMAVAAAHATKFSQFLDARSCEIALCASRNADCQQFLFGGYPLAQRQILCLYPQFFSMTHTDFPIETIHFRFKKEYNLSHRDVLGTILSQGVKREAVGDILIGEGQAVVYVLNSIAWPIINDIEKIGGIGIKSAFGLPDDFLPKTDKSELSTVVSSMRLDTIVAALTGESRETAQKLILNGLVKVNARVSDKSPFQVNMQDEISIRGHGKFQITDKHETKKGRIRISFFKFI